MRQIFVSSSDIRGGRAFLSGPAHHHLVRVLRVQPGEVLRLVDERGRRYRASILNVGPGEAQAELTGEEPAEEEAGFTRLCVCVPKGGIFEEILDGATQLGIDEIVPLVSERTIPRWKGGDVEPKMRRWRSVLVSASQQCNRSRVPQLLAPLPLEGIGEVIGKDPCLWSFERAPVPLHLELARLGTGLERATLVVGPEGGFTDEEAGWGAARGARLVSLGPRILRTPLACFHLVSALSTWRNLRPFSEEA